MKTEPQKPATSEGKQREAQMPLISMSAIRASDIEAARSHILETGGIHAPLVLGPTHHRVEPDVGVLAILEEPELVTVGVLDDAGGPIGQSSGDPSLEQIRWLDEMVVDRNDRDTDRARLRVG